MSDRRIPAFPDAVHYTRLFPLGRGPHAPYRAECSCGQAREGDRETVTNWAAGHDLPPIDEVAA